MKKSSNEARHDCHVCPARIMSSVCCNVAGAFVKPNCIFSYSEKGSMAHKRGLISIFFGERILSISTVTVLCSKDGYTF